MAWLKVSPMGWPASCAWYARYRVISHSRARGVSETDLQKLVIEHTEGRQFGILGEPRVNVLELNLAMDERFPVGKK